MTYKSTDKKIDEIKTQLELLKKRLDNIDKILNIQEETLDLLCENTEALFNDALRPSKNEISPEEIMRNAFKSKRLPKILFAKK